MVTIHAMICDENIGWRKLLLGSNSTYVVTPFRTELFSMPWKWYFACADYLEKVSHMDFQCSRIYREVDVASNRIESWALSIYVTI